MSIKRIKLVFAILISTLFINVNAGTLVINSGTSDPAEKVAFEEMIEAFKAENPDVEVELNVFDREGFKTSIRNFLTSSAPDVVTWYAGERMKTFVDKNLFEDVSDIWQANGLAEAMAPSLSAMTIDGKQYGIPYGYYQWGIFYRKDIFEQNSIEAPATWEQFVSAGKKLKDAGVTPVAIGTKFLWTAAGWFDYLNLRVNGLAFHIDLMSGKIPYTDERVKKVFTYWKELIDAGFFIENHATYSWQEAQPFLFQGKAAMYLIGNFFTQFFPPELDGKMGFFPFPIINPDVPLAEDAPTDTLHIPAKAANKEDARKFLEFVSRAEVQSELNSKIKYLPPNKNSSIPDDEFLQAGFELLNDASGTAQFFDRDTNPEMAKVGMKGLQEFMVKPDRMDKILKRIEKARKRIYK